MLIIGINAPPEANTHTHTPLVYSFNGSRMIMKSINRFSTSRAPCALAENRFGLTLGGEEGEERKGPRVVLIYARGL